MSFGLNFAFSNMLLNKGTAESDPILALFANGEQGVYGPNRASTYYTDTSLTTPASLTDPVGGISDASGNTNHVLQPDAAKRALRITGGLGFDANDDHYEFPAAAMGLASSSNTFVAAVRVPSSPSFPSTKPLYLLAGADGSNRDRGFLLLLNSNGTIRVAVNQSAGLVIASGSTDIRGVGWIIYSARYDRANQTLIGRINGTTEFSEEVADSDKLPVTVGLLGERSDGEGRQWPGDVGTFALTDGAATDSALQAAEAAVAAEYGITL